jgi:hypothetical protein
MPRFSLSAVMGFVLVSAVGLAALRNANEVWVGILLMLVAGMVGVALLGVFFERGRNNAWWAGFAVFAGSYLTLAFGPWCKDQIQPKLATTQFFGYVHSQITLSSTSEPSINELLNVRLNSLLEEQRYLQRLVTNPDDLSLKLMQNKVNDLKAQLGGSTKPAASYARTKVWQFLLPGASTGESFIQVAHCLFAILAGWLGAMVATRFYVTRQRRELTAVSSGVDGSRDPGNAL